MNIIHPVQRFLWGASVLNSWSQLIDVVLFADDTNIFFSHKELQYVINTLNMEWKNCLIGFKQLRGPLGKIHSLVWGRRNRFSSYFAYELDFGQY